MEFIAWIILFAVLSDIDSKIVTVYNKLKEIEEKLGKK